MKLHGEEEFKMPELLKMLGSVAPFTRRALANVAGMTFEGFRDLYEALGYQRVLKPIDYRARYLRNGIAARIVESLPMETWRGDGGELIEDEDPDVSTEFEKAWDDLSQKLNIWSAFMQLDILAGLGRYSVMLIGAPGDLSTPLTRQKGPEKLFYVTSFAEDDAPIESFDLNLESPRFGSPTFYQLKRVNAATGTKELIKRVHWTRILHVADGKLDDNVFGIPRLERIWNNLDDLEKITGAGSEAFWLRAHQGYQFDLDKDMQLSPEGEKDLKAETDEFANGMRRMVRTRGVKLKTLGSDVADFSRPVDAILTLISGAVGIPKRILIGSERGQLASMQDRTNWHDRVNDRRVAFAGPYVVRPLVDRLIEYGFLPKPAKYEVRWPQIQNLDEIEQATVAKEWAAINGAFGGNGIVVTADEIRDRILGLPALTPEQIKENTPEVPPQLQPGDNPSGFLPRVDPKIDKNIRKDKTVQGNESMPTVIVNTPEPKKVKKTFIYGEVNGVIRPTGVTEEEVA